MVAGLAVHQIRGEGGGGPLGDLVEEGVALHRALGGGGETAGLVQRHALQVEVEGDVLGGGVVDGRIPIRADALAQPLGREGRGAFGCRLRQRAWAGAGGSGGRRAGSAPAAARARARTRTSPPARGNRSRRLPAAAEAPAQDTGGQTAGYAWRRWCQPVSDPAAAKGADAWRSFEGLQTPLAPRRRTRSYGLSSLSQVSPRRSATAAMA